MKKYIPNSLTLIRVLLVPVFCWLIYYSNFKYNFLLATLVFIIASITDIFDGLLARKFGVVTNFGKIMDPLADKFLSLLALIALISKPIELMDVYVFYIILFREVFITLLRQYYLMKKIYIPANVWGKVKTTFQLTGIISALVYHSLLHPIIPEHHSKFQLGFNIFFWITAVITVFSGITYLFPKAREGK